MAFSVTTTTGSTFSNGDSATATKLNAQVNSMTFHGAANSFFGFDASGNPIDGSFANGLSVASGVASLTYRPQVLTSDFSVSNNTTLAASSLSYNLPNSGTFAFQINAMMVQVGSASGYKFAVGGSATGTLLWTSNALDGTTNANNAAFGTVLGAGGASSASGAVFLTFNGTLIVSGSGTLAFMFAQLSSQSNASILKAGSYMTLQTI